VTEPLHMVDWYPTLLKLTGVSLDQKLPLDGRDAWPTIALGRPSPHEDILLNTTPANGAIRVGNWKLVLNGGRSEIDGEGTAEAVAKTKQGKPKPQGGETTVELFDLAVDPLEKTNLAEQQPDKTRELRARLAAYAAAAVPPKSAPQAADFQVPKIWGEP